MTARRWLGVSLLLASTALLGAGCAAGIWIPVGPPDEQVEVRGLMPAPGYVWIDGYWQWHSRWVWQPGRWTRPPHAGARWERGRWERSERGWRWHDGRWQ